MAGPRYDDVVEGAEVPPQTFRVTRADLVRYAGASGDFNPIHWNERVARGVGLPNVIAHGMYTMGLASRVVTSWIGAGGAVLEYGTRFTRPVVVPDDDRGVTVTVTGVVKRKLEDHRIQVVLTVTCGDEKVLVKTEAVVRLPS